MQPTIDEIKEHLQELQSSSLDKLVLVEGKKDKIALSKLNIKNIITLTKPLYQIVEYTINNCKQCIILVDLDSEGKKLYHKLKHQLQKYGIKVDDKFRNFLLKQTNLTQIEGLYNYLNRNKISPLFYRR